MSWDALNLRLYLDPDTRTNFSGRAAVAHATFLFFSRHRCCPEKNISENARKWLHKTYSWGESPWLNRWTATSKQVGSNSGNAITFFFGLITLGNVCTSSPPSYGLNNLTFILLQGFLWNQITKKTNRLLNKQSKPNQMTFSRLKDSSCFFWLSIMTNYHFTRVRWIDFWVFFHQNWELLERLNITV